MTFDLILKLLKKRGGYPNEFSETLLEVLNLTQHEFLNSMIEKFGKEGAENFIEQSLRNKSKEGPIKVSAGPYVAPGFEKDSFIEFDFSDVNVSIDGEDNPYWSTIVLENWTVSDSNIVIETEDGDIETWDIHGFLSVLQDEDPWGFRDAVDDVRNAIKKDLEKLLGVRVYLDFTPDRRE